MLLRFKKCLRYTGSWISKFIRDLFMGTGNLGWELGRILTALSTSALVFAAAWNMYLAQPIDLGPGGFGGGLAGIITAGGLFIGAKAWARKRNADALVPATDSPPEGEGQ